MRLSRARGAGEQNGRARTDRHALYLFDQPVELRVARGDAILEELQRLGLGLMEALSQSLVARQIQVDQDHAARRSCLLLARRRGLQQHARYLARLHHEEHADLRHMGARRDVYPVVLALGVKAIVACPVIERGIHLAKIPGVLDFRTDQIDLGFRRDIGNVLHQDLGQLVMAAGVQQLQPVYHGVFMLHQRHRGPPFLPAPRTLP